ncbi:hypothetical protein Fmac_008793 [Flemingia macrophylla]|uniref:Uncharacterized protein n=1 Tax=Flemingia macrophylla TaxID=520843 RepID=A0ABD1MYH7_9FABA
MGSPSQSKSIFYSEEDSLIVNELISYSNPKGKSKDVANDPASPSSFPGYEWVREDMRTFISILTSQSQLNKSLVGLSIVHPKYANLVSIEP